jgi:hypothetical protein
MSSGAMIYVPNFVKIGSGIGKVMGREIFTDTEHGDLISVLLYILPK